MEIPYLVASLCLDWHELHHHIHAEQRRRRFFFTCTKGDPSTARKRDGFVGQPARFDLCIATCCIDFLVSVQEAYFSSRVADAGESSNRLVPSFGSWIRKNSEEVGKTELLRVQLQMRRVHNQAFEIHRYFCALINSLRCMF